MTDKREEVLRKLAGFERDWMGGDNLSIVFCGLIESHLELDQDPDSDHSWHEDVEAELGEVKKEIYTFSKYYLLGGWKEG